MHFDIFSRQEQWNCLDFEVKRSDFKVMTRPNVVENYLFKNHNASLWQRFTVEAHLVFLWGLFSCRLGSELRHGLVTGVVLNVVSTSRSSWGNSVCCQCAQRVQFKLAVLVYKALNGQASLRGWLPAYHYCRLPSSNVATYEVLVQVWVISSFTVAGPRLWNNLPLHLSDSELTLLVFCRLLKTHLLCRGQQRIVTVAFRAPYEFYMTFTYHRVDLMDLHHVQCYDLKFDTEYSTRTNNS